MSNGSSDKRMHDVKAGIDLALMACLVALPRHASAGDSACGILGWTLLALLVAHNVLSLRWWRSLRRGGWRATRVLQLVVTVLGVGLAVGVCVVCWAFLAMSFHVGQCVWPMFRAELAGHGHVRREVSPAERRMREHRAATASAALAIVGVAAFTLLGFPTCLTFASEASLGAGVPGVLVAAGLACVLLAFASLGAWSQEGLSHLKR